MIKIVAVCLLLSVSIASPSLLVVSIPVTYLALRSWHRQRVAAREFARLLTDQRRHESIARGMRVGS